MLAGVSVDYYTRLERGNLKGVSESVLDALARGLRLDGAERAHLFDLARAAGPTTARPRRRSPQKVRPSVQRILDSMTGAPAFAQNGRLDVLAANRLGRALYSEMFANPTRPANLARFVFSNLRSRDFFADWDRRSEEFRTRWAAHDVRIHRTGVKNVRHPVVGDLDLTFAAPIT